MSAKEPFKLTKSLGGNGPSAGEVKPLRATKVGTLERTNFTFRASCGRLVVAKTHKGEVGETQADPVDFLF